MSLFCHIEGPAGTLTQHGCHCASPQHSKLTIKEVICTCPYCGRVAAGAGTSLGCQVGTCCQSVTTHSCHTSQIPCRVSTCLRHDSAAAGNFVYCLRTRSVFTQAAEARRPNLRLARWLGGARCRARPGQGRLHQW